MNREKGEGSLALGIWRGGKGNKEGEERRATS